MLGGPEKAVMTGLALQLGMGIEIQSLGFGVGRQSLAYLFFSEKKRWLR